MIKVVAKKFVKKDKIDEMIKLCKELADATRNEKGCIKYGLYQDEKDSTILSFIEEWETKEDLERHVKSEHFIKIVPQFPKLMSKEGETNIYNQII